MAYVPPKGKNVALGFLEEGYTPPRGSRVALTFGAASPYDTQFLVEWAWVSSDFGIASVANVIRAIAPGGLAPPPQTGPNEDRQLPDPTIAYWTRNVYPVGVAPQTWTNTHYVAWEIQYIDQAGQGWVSSDVGQPTVDFALRTIYPQFIASMVFGAHRIARQQFLVPTGLGSTNAFGTAQLDINLQRLFPSGIASAGYGQPAARNEREFVRPQAITEVGPGFPVVQNLKRYVNVGMYRDNGNPEFWAPYSPLVENKIRVLGPSGWKSSRFSVIGNFIENKARAIAPTGWDSFVWSPGNFIGHYTRYITYTGWDSSHSSIFHNAHNGARVLSLAGWASSRFGTPSDVRNLNRTVIHHSGPSDATYGTAFVSFSPRTVSPGLFYDIYFPLPTVRLNPYPIAPAGIAPPANTAATVYEHFNILGPASANVHAVPWVGEPFVQNRNKTLRPFPSDQALYGRPTVANYNTHLTVGAGDTARYGSALIEHRTKTIYAATITLPTFPVWHQIRNVLPDPPSQQLILPTSFSTYAVPTPAIYVRGIFPSSILPGNITAPNVRGTGIRALSIVTVDNFGFPTVIGAQYLRPKSVPWPETALESGALAGSSDLNWTKNWSAGYEYPRLSPHTVYAPRGEPTAQAVRNNPPYPEPEYHVIDGLMNPGFDNSRNPFFGETWVSLKNRSIGPVPDQTPGVHNQLDPSSVVSSGAVVDLRLRYVFPEGIRSQRFGRTVFWGVPQYVSLDPDHNGILPGDWYDPAPPVPPPVPPSIHTVAFPEPFHRTVYPTGFAGAFGATTIELFNREIAPQGIPHRGNPEQGLTNPWGVPLVGYPRTYPWGGYDMTLWGTAWVSHKIRNVYPEGWNSDTLEDTFIDEFDARMRVHARDYAITPVPFGGPAFGTGVVTFSLRGVLGRGLSSYTSGTPTVSSLAVIYPSGWDSAEYGDIDEWEADKIKPHGDDLSSVGIPKLLHPLYPSSVNDGALGVVRVCRVINVAGLPPVGFDGPSVTDPYGCSLRVVTPLPILSQQTVPQPVVAHV